MAAEFKDCKDLAKFVSFVGRNLFLSVFFSKIYIAVLCSQKSFMCEPIIGFHVFVFKGLIELCTTYLY